MSNHPDRPAAVTTPPTRSLTREPPPNQCDPTSRTARHLEIVSPGPDSTLIRCLTEFLLSDIAKIQLIFPIREPSYVEYIHEPYLRLWTEAERDWASGLYHRPGFQSVRERYIEIARALDTTRPGPERSRLVEEMHKLER